MNFIKHNNKMAPSKSRARVHGRVFNADLFDDEKSEVNFQQRILDIKYFFRSLPFWPQLVPVRLELKDSESEILKKSLVESIEIESPDFAQNLKRHFYAPQFWLGLTSSAALYKTTKLIFGATKTSVPELKALIAYMGAGAAVGVSVYLVRKFRDRRIVGIRKPGWSKHLLDNAVTGLVGAWLGGYVIAASSVILKTNHVGLGVAIGVMLGVPCALALETKDTLKIGAVKSWAERMLQGAVFGAIGGILGILCSSALMAHHPATVSVQMAVVAPAQASPAAMPVWGTATPAAVKPTATADVSPPTPYEIILSAQDEATRLQALKVAENALRPVGRR